MSLSDRGETIAGGAASTRRLTGGRRVLRARPPVLALPLVAGLSYLTSFLRERYLIQQGLGSGVLDQAVVAYVIAAMVGNTCAVALGLMWIDGRRLPRWATHFEVYVVAGLGLMVVWPTAGACLVLAALVYAFELSRQKAAFGSRQIWALLMAVVAPATTVAVWVVAGTGSETAILGGYAVGYLVQATAAWWLARPVPAPQHGHARVAGMGWPAAFAAMCQLNGILDPLLLLWMEPGWAAAGAFSLNLANAVMLVVVAPLASEAIAGKVRSQPSVRLMALVGVSVALGLAVTPWALPVVIGGGTVEGANLDKVLWCTAVYLLALPAAGYWTFRARALQRSSLRWRSTTEVTAIMIGVHLLISVPVAVAGQPQLVPVGFLVASYVGAALLAGTKETPAAHRPAGSVAH